MDHWASRTGRSIGDSSSNSLKRNICSYGWQILPVICCCDRVDDGETDLAMLPEEAADLPCLVKQ